MIDHTLLKADASKLEIENLCSQAKDFGFFGVCIHSCWVPFAQSYFNSSSALLSSSEKTFRPAIISVVGFPLGAMATKSKAHEAQTAVAAGADEIDMVINLGWIKSLDWKNVTQDIAAVVQAASGKAVKVILETHLLSHDEKVMACEAALQAGAHFVKTSTGFSGGGASLEDVRLLKSVVGEKCQVKASGGIRSLDQAMSYVNAGATRLGTSSGIQLLQSQTVQAGY